MKTLIITGGDYSGTAPDGCFDLTVAADSGLATAQRLGITPDVVLGDFDSLGYVPRGNFEVLTHPAHKDETDTMLAASVARERGADEIVILGGLGGRADHTVSNLFLLEALADDGVHAVLTDGSSEARVLLEGDGCCVPYGEYRYFSVFALEPSVVSEDGCEYPLSHAALTRANAYAVSNEPLPGGAHVTCESGRVLLIRSEKP